MSSTIDTDLFYSLEWEDPYPSFHKLRAMRTLRRLDSSTMLVTGYDACLAVLRNPLASNDLRRERLDGQARAAGSSMLDRFDSFLYRDPPEHTRIRHAVLDALRAYPVEATAREAAATAGQLLDGCLRLGTCDAVTELAQRLPARLTAHMFGIDEADTRSIAVWARDITLGLEPAMTPADVRRRMLALYEFADFLSDHVRRNRAAPPSNLLGALIRKEKSGQLVDDDLIATVMLFLAALFGSTIDMVGSLVAAMARNPDQYARIRRQPDLIPCAVEELFRYESPFQLIYRLATEGIQVEGFEVPRGMRLALMLGAANRDPARFHEPDRFDAGRTPNRHLAFGSGLHNCIGVAYSRAWSQAALTAMVARVAALAPAGPFQARPKRAFRGYASVPVSWQERV